MKTTVSKIHTHFLRCAGLGMMGYLMVRAGWIRWDREAAWFYAVFACGSIAATLWVIFTAPESGPKAEQWVIGKVQRIMSRIPKLARWLDTNFVPNWKDCKHLSRVIVGSSGASLALVVQIPIAISFILPNMTLGRMVFYEILLAVILSLLIPIYVMLPYILMEDYYYRNQTNGT